MKSLFIDIHTHLPNVGRSGCLRIPSVIAGKETIIEGELYTLGIHPWYLDNYLESFEYLQQHSLDTNLIAIGECGLDKLADRDMPLQERVFRLQIELAQHLQKALIIHCVRSYGKIDRILQEMRVSVPIVFHAFTRGKELGLQFVKRGYYLSLGHHILSNKQDDLIRSIPLERLFLETDGKVSDVQPLYEYFANVRGIPMTQLKEIIVSNFTTVFNTLIK